MYNTLPYNFYWKDYILLNSLSHIKSEFEAVKHYLHHGKKLKKKHMIIENFNWKIYLKNNTEITDLTTPSQTINHYFEKGYLDNKSYLQDKSLPIHKKFFEKISNHRPNLVFVTYGYNNIDNIYKNYKNNLLKYIHNDRVRFVLINFKGNDYKLISKYVIIIKYEIQNRI